jgi:hypothetical protein
MVAGMVSDPVGGMAWQMPVVPYVYEYETHVDYRGELFKPGHVRP